MNRLQTLTRMAYGPDGKLTTCLSYVEQLELIGLQHEILKCLPKTADGSPVVPGMGLWRQWPDIAPECETIQTCQVKAVHTDGANLYCIFHGDGYRETPVPCSELFSTREAAEAAKDNQPKGND